MAHKVVLLKNTELEACLKIVTDNAVGTTEKVSVDLNDFCFKPIEETCGINQETANQFQQIGTKIKPSVKLVHGQWSGLNGSCNCRIYRADKDDDELSIENLVATVCVGDTTQLEFDSQAYCADGELLHKQKLVFVVDGEMTLWFKFRKHGFESFAGEYATYGAFEDDKRRGPYERYETTQS